MRLQKLPSFCCRSRSTRRSARRRRCSGREVCSVRMRSVISLARTSSSSTGMPYFASNVLMMALWNGWRRGTRCRTRPCPLSSPPSMTFGRSRCRRRAPPSPATSRAAPRRAPTLSSSSHRHLSLFCSFIRLHSVLIRSLDDHELHPAEHEHQHHHHQPDDADLLGKPLLHSCSITTDSTSVAGRIEQDRGADSSRMMPKKASTQPTAKAGHGSATRMRPSVCNQPAPWTREHSSRS